MPADVELGIRVTKRGDGADKVARDLKQAARAADDLGDELERVDRKLIETRALMAAAGKEFLKTGDISPLKQLLKDERQLNLVKKSLSSIGDEVEKLGRKGTGKQGFLLRNAHDAAESIAQSTGRALPLLSNPYIAAGIAGAITAGAPLIAAAVSAAVSGAALGGGIALAFRSPTVKAAFTGLGQDILGELDKDATVFIDPLLRQAVKLRAAFRDLNIGAVFREAVKDLDPLVDGIIGFARNVMPSLLNVLRQGHPVIAELGRSAQTLGGAFGAFLDDMASAGPGAAQGLRLVTNELGLLVRLSGGSIVALSGIIDWIGKLDSKYHVFTGAFGILADELAKSDQQSKLPGAEEGAKHLLDLGEAAEEAKQKIVSLEQAARDAFTGQINLDQSTIRFRESLRGLKAEIEDHSKHIKDNTARLDANRQSVLALVGDAQSIFDAELAAGVGLDEASGHLYGNLKALEANAVKAGLNREQVRSLLQTYLAMAAAPNIAKEIYIARTEKTVYETDYIVHRQGERASSSSPPPTYSQRQHGGPVLPGRAYLVGEGGRPEILTMGASGGYVTPLGGGGQARMPAGWGGRSSGATYSITVNAGMGTRGQDVGAAVVSAIKDYERSNGAGWRN